MSAKPTALATVVVVVAGVATGVAIGGRTETRTQTQTVTVAGAPETAGSAITPGAPVSPAPPPSAEPEPNPAFDPEVLDDELVTVDDTTRSAREYEYSWDTVTLTDVKYGVPAQLQQGPEHSDAMTFDFESSSENDYAADYYQFEITVPDQATMFVSQMGFLKGEATGNSVKVAFYKNEYKDGQHLKQATLDSASETAPVRLVVRGASKIIVRLTCTNKGRSWKTPDNDDPSFGFVDAHFE